MTSAPDSRGTVLDREPPAPEVMFSNERPLRDAETAAFLDPPRTFSQHLRRSLIRLFVLVSADIGVFLLARQVLRALRSGALGETIAAGASVLFPSSSVPGPQLALAIVGSLLVFGAYRTGDHWRDPAQILLATAGAVLLAFYAELWSGADPVVVVFRALSAWAVLGIMLALMRLTVHALVERSPWGRIDHRVVVVNGQGAVEVPSFGARYRVLTTSDSRWQLSDALHGQRADTVLVNGTLPADDFTRMIDEALTRGVRMLALPRSGALPGVEPRRVVLQGTPLVELTTPTLRASQMMMKRTMDTTLSLLLLFLLSPVFLLIAAWIRIESGGPVFFRQARPGFRGRPFNMLKFRSMRTDAEEVLRKDPDLYQRFLDNGCKLPPEDDFRLTPSGRFLRRTSLDELPQLLNVLRGDMSLVGPRPLVGPELENYGGSASLLFSVRPGITGPWQVSGRSRVAFPARADLDLDYVRGWSIFRDLWILLITIPVVLLQRGAH